MSDPRTIVDKAPISAFQAVAIGLCIVLNSLDGFDVLSISFASPGIAAEWGIARGALGVVLSMELIGMAIGSIVIGDIADRIGRRPTIIVCLITMAGGMYLASTADSIRELAGFRFATGIGIGGMLAATNAMVAEFSNARRRSLAVTFMAAGYPLGAIAGGSIASILLEAHNWRSVFVFGAIATATMLPFVVMSLPESIDFLARRRSPRALAKINKTLKRMGHAAATTLAPATAKVRTGIGELFSPALARATTLMTIGYFAHIMTFYFILKWIPKIVVDMGFAPSAAGGVLVWANVGGASGAILLGLLSQKISVRGLVIGALVSASVMVTIFGRGQPDLEQLALVAGLSGFFTNSAIVGIYALMAGTFPAELRAGGTGFVIGLGRGGAALGPIVAGYLFQAGATLQIVALLMASGSLIAAVAFSALRGKGAAKPERRT